MKMTIRSKNKKTMPIFLLLNGLLFVAFMLLKKNYPMAILSLIFVYGGIFFLVMKQELIIDNYGIELIRNGKTRNKVFWDDIDSISIRHLYSSPFMNNGPITWISYGKHNGNAMKLGIHDQQWEWSLVMQALRDRLPKDKMDINTLTYYGLR